MRNKTKIVISLLLIVGFIAITSNQLISPVVSDPPFDDDPDDPGNSTGPGFFDSIPVVDIDFKFICEDSDFSQNNFQL
ncbi:MAG: hypothetical protein ACTSQK_07995 [Candidatus Heimdallarchaeota archaeon]